jgi:hypothetical protein
MRPLRSSAVTALVVATLVASSCSDSPSTGADPSSGAAPAAAGDEPTDRTSAEAEALINERIASFDPDNLDAIVAEAAALDRTVELDMAEWSGLEEALGGPDSTNAAFASQDQFYAALTGAVSEPPALGFRRVQADRPSIGMGMFGGFMVVGLGSKAIVQAGNGDTGGRIHRHRDGRIRRDGHRSHP